MAVSADIAENLQRVRGRIASAAQRSGREASEITLVAVSKVHPVDVIRVAYAAGQRVFGESYVQELAAKVPALSDLADLTFHFVGHLQRNKAKDVARLRAVVETVDSERLARALSRRAEAEGVRLEVLVQVNVGGEEQKSGCALEDAPALIAAVKADGALDLKGLMTIPPPTRDPSGARRHFVRLRDLRDAHLPGLGLSMGMSHDLEVAVEEGATLVRVGTAIFGSRPAR